MERGCEGIDTKSEGEKKPQKRTDPNKRLKGANRDKYIYRFGEDGQE